MNDTEIIKEIYRQYWKYMITKNEAGTNGAFAETSRLEKRMEHGK
jgi:hypothetical protein